MLVLLKVKILYVLHVMFFRSLIGFTAVFPVVLAQNLNAEDAIDICTQISVTGQAGYLKSPNYPELYPNDLNCMISIFAPTNKVIHVYFLDFELEQSNFCAFDDLQVYDGNIRFYDRTFCGTSSPRNFTAGNRNVTLTMETDDDTQAKGFLVYWTTTDACLSNQFTCWNGACISESQHCDGVKHCNDDSDEIECAQTSQNNAECGKQDVAPQFVWNLRIVGGNEAISNSWPWQAVVEHGDGTLLCGAAVLTTEWLVTSAHCLGSLTIHDIRVFAGRHTLIGTLGSQQSVLQEIVIHPNYDSVRKLHDMALLRLFSPFNFTTNVRSICVPSNTSDFNVQPGTQCIATGWGLIGQEQVSPDNLQQVRVPIIDPNICETVYGTNFTDSHVCAGDYSKGGIGVCQGDFGGPLACLVDETTWYVIGVASYAELCGQAGYPSVFTKISVAYDWIVQVVYDGSIPTSSTTMTTTTPTTTETSTTTTSTPPVTNTAVPQVVACEGNVTTTLDAATLTSPGYPETYPKSVNCQWTIITTADKVIEVYFNNFDIESDSLCRFDYLEVYDDLILYTGRRLCGNQKPRDFSALGHVVRIVFHSDDLHEERGFSITYRTSARCGDSEYQCWNGACVPLQSKCDGRRDCADDSDEIECEKPPSRYFQCGKVQTPPQFTWDLRVVGGSASVAGSWPWHAVLSNASDSVPFCGGSIIATRWILTSAYCVRNYVSPAMLRVDVGKAEFDVPGEQHSNVSEIHRHPAFESQLFTSDLALLKLTHTLTYTPNVRPVCYPAPNFVLDFNLSAIASGFGSLVVSRPNPTLFQVRLPLVNRTTCSTTYSYIAETQLCAGGRPQGQAGLCEGDAGGPLVMLIDEITWYVVGVTSVPLSCRNGEAPSVFTNVASFSRWIEDTILLSEAPTCASNITLPSYTTFLMALFLLILWL